MSVFDYNFGVSQLNLETTVFRKMPIQNKKSLFMFKSKKILCQLNKQFVLHLRIGWTLFGSHASSEKPPIFESRVVFSQLKWEKVVLSQLKWEKVVFSQLKWENVFFCLIKWENVVFSQLKWDIVGFCQLKWENVFFV